MKFLNDDLTYLEHIETLQVDILPSIFIWVCNLYVAKKEDILVLTAIYSSNSLNKKI